MQKTKSGKLDIAKVQNSLAINYLNHPNNRDLDKAFILLKAAFKNMEDDPEPLLMGSVLDCLSFIELEMKNYVVSLDMAYGAREMYRLGNAGSSVEKVLNKRIKRLRKYVKRK